MLKPAKTKDLYFVADGTGGHAFAPSLDAHNDNVARWRQIERAKREQERAEAAAAAAAAAQGSPERAVPNGAAGAPAPGTLVAPDALIDGQPSAGLTPAPGGATPAEAAPAEAAPEGGAGAGFPLPKRNPLR